MYGPAGAARELSESKMNQTLGNLSDTSTSNPDDWRNILVFSILVILLANLLIFYLFFSARLFGFVLGTVVNAFLLKNKGEFSVKSVQISLMTGRLFVCDVSFGSSSFAFRFIDAIISVNWWGSWSDESPWIFLTVAGLEYTIINHSSQYDRLDHILNLRHTQTKSQEQQVNIEQVEPDDDFSNPVLFWLSKIVKLKFDGGCLRIGNNRLPTVLLISFSRADGSLSLVPGRESEGTHIKTKGTELEYQRIVLDLVMYDSSIDIKQNRSYVPTIIEEDPRRLEPVQESSLLDPAGQAGQLLTNFLSVLKDITFPSRVDPSLPSPAEDEEAGPDDRAFETRGIPGIAGRSRPRGLRSMIAAPWVRGDHVLSSPLMRLRYYDELVRPRATALADLPERGVFLDILHGSMVYGPWENRQRALIQRHFLPPDFERRVPYTPETAGPQSRAGFRFGVDFRGSIVLRVPYAESGPGRRADHASAHERTAAAAGWLSLTAGVDPFAATGGVERVGKGSSGRQQQPNDEHMAADGAAGETSARQPSPLQSLQRNRSVATDANASRELLCRSPFQPSASPILLRPLLSTYSAAHKVSALQLIIAFRLDLLGSRTQNPTVGKTAILPLH